MGKGFGPSVLRRRPVGTSPEPIHTTETFLPDLPSAKAETSGRRYGVAVLGGH